MPAHGALSFRQNDNTAPEGPFLKAETIYETYWAHTPESLFTIRVAPNDDFIFDGINPAHQIRTGLTAARIVGKRPQDCLPADIATAICGNYQRCVDARAPIRYSELLDLPGGQRLWETSLAPVFDSDGKVRLILGSARDMTERARSMEHITALNRRLETILSSISEAYYTIGSDWTLTGVNSRAEAWLGASAEDLIGRDAREVFAFDPKFAPMMTEVRESGRAAHFTIPSVLRSGRWLDITVYPGAHDLSVFFRDVTDREVARLNLQEAQALLRATIDALPAHVAVLDERGVIISVNEAWRRFASENGYAGRAWEGVDYLAVSRASADSSDEAARAHAELQSLIGGETNGFFLTYACGARQFQVRATSFAVNGARQHVLVHEDVSELTFAYNGLRELSERLLALQEEERRRIAVELHDSTAQHLVAIGLSLSSLRDLVVPTPQAEILLTDLKRSADEALKELRAFSYLLSPPNLVADGLASTLRRFLAGFGRRTGLEIVTRISDRIDRASLPVRTTIFRVVQECMANTHRHARATTVWVNAELRGGAIALRIEDDGCGFEAAGEDEAQLGVGIPGMLARVRQFGGTLSVGRGRGTLVIAKIPLTAQSMDPVRSMDPLEVAAFATQARIPGL